MFYLRLSIFLCLFLLAQPAWGRDFFVDAQKGNDKWSGTVAGGQFRPLGCERFSRCQDGPWRSLEKVSRANLRPGDRVFLKKGQVFYGQLDVGVSGEFGKPIFFGVYGQGAKPEISGAFDLKKLAWRQVAKNIWSSEMAKTSLKEQLKGEVRASLVSLNETAIGHLQKTGDKALSVQIESATNNRFDLQLDLASSQLAVEAGKIYELRFKARASESLRLGAINLLENTAPWSNLAKETAIAEIGPKETEVRLFFKSVKASRQAKITVLLGDLPADSSFELNNLSFGQATIQSGYLLRDVGSLRFGTSFGRKLSDFDDLSKPGDFYFSHNDSRLFFFSEKPPTAWPTLLAAQAGNLINIDGRSNLHFENWRLTDGGSHGFYATEVRNIRIHQCDFYNLGGSYQYATTRFGNGLEFWNGASGIRVDHNNFFMIYDAPITNQGVSGSQRFIEYDHNYANRSGLGLEVWLLGGGELGPLHIHHNLIINGGEHHAYVDRPDQRASLLEFGYTEAKLSKVLVEKNLFSSSRYLLLLLDDSIASADGLTIRNNLWWQALADKRVLFDCRQTGFTPASFYLLSKTCKPFEENNIWSNPLFDKVADLRYVLTKLSPFLKF